ncbi:MAG: alpha/beta fold hydrolase [Candidatus Latescibacteria bacterium]|nr:alpha/beta fold hydrolase [Candidatus Latescibacterota bacterium]
MNPVQIPPFHLQAGRTGVLLIHGLTASPTEMRPLGHFLHQQGLTVLGLRLPGHGTTPDDLAQTHWQDWYAECEAGLDKLLTACDRVFVSGLSAGGVLGVLLALRHPDRVAGLSLLAPAFVVRPPLLWLAAPLRPFIKAVDKGNRSSAYYHQHDLFSYPVFPTPALVELRRLIKATQPQLARLQAPVQLFFGRFDRTVPIHSGLPLFNRLGSRNKTLAILPASKHVLTVEPDAPRMFQAIAQFIDRTRP